MILEGILNFGTRVRRELIINYITIIWRSSGLKMKYLQPLRVFTFNVTSFVFLHIKWWDFGSPQFLHVCRKILIAMGGEVVLALDEGLGILGSCQGGTCWKWATTKSFTLIVEICGRFCFIWTNSSRLQDLSCHFRICHLVFNLLLSQFFFPRESPWWMHLPMSQNDMKWQFFWRSKFSRSRVSGSDSELKETVRV